MRKLLILVAVCMLVSCHADTDKDVFVIPSVSYEMEITPNALLEDRIWEEALVTRSLHAPWDGLDDETLIRTVATPSKILMRFDVNDADVMYNLDFTEDNIDLLEDRVEIFFSPRKEMDIYYCAEFSPVGSILDYSSRCYRKMDYGWDFESLKVIAAINKEGFSIVTCFDRTEVERLMEGLETFYMGLFRADYHNDRAENWYSLVPTIDSAPDFHIPAVLFAAKIK